LSSPSTRRWGKGGVAALSFALVTSPLAQTSPASANTAGTGLVISEVYGGGGNAGSTYRNDFVELYNPTDAAISLSGKSLQYRSANPTDSTPVLSNVVALTGTVPAHGHWLLQAAPGTGGTTGLPKPDQTSGAPAISGTGGQVFLANRTDAFNPGTGPIAHDDVIDFVGWGGSTTSYEGTAPAAATTNPTAVARAAAGTDTDSNSADFTVGAPTPKASGLTGGTDPEPPTPAEPKTIEEIQGTGPASPLVDHRVVTRGIVTAAYPTGGLNGFYLQTPGTGADANLDTHQASDAVFVYMGNNAAATAYPAIGDHVSVTGTVTEFNGLTELNAEADGITPVAETAAAPTPVDLAWPASDARREALEGMLAAPQGAFTVTDNFDLNSFAQIGLARGTQPLRQPTDVARPGAAATAVATQNATRLVTLDDGSSTNYLSSAKDVPLPYLTPDKPVRVGAAVKFERPVIVDYRNDLWKFQPTRQLLGGPNGNADTVQPATFSDTRTAHPETVGGDLKIASFNVLNYFKETGVDWEAETSTNDCTFFNDRTGDPVTVNSCNGDGPRGAAEDEDKSRQQAKIVDAINALGADVLSLEEIENSAKYDGPDGRDAALSALVDALNADADSPVWSYVASPAAGSRPALTEEDVIRTAFIYKNAKVSPVGAAQILTGSAAFASAREPLAQVFKPVGGAANQQFAVIVNHFKSKGSGTGADADQNDGQGASNATRVAEAKALVAFANDVKVGTGTKTVFLTGDFNAYTREDPMQVLYDAGYTDIGSTMTDESTYLFDGVVGSLDHVLGNAPAMSQVTGADVWNINSVESVAFEYSRHNYNATDFYSEDPFRSSDHDPLLVGFNPPAADATVALNLLGMNDFHGRIDSSTTKWATTVERLRDAAGADETLFLSAGDNVGASLFPSASAEDNPTVDVLNALGLDASSVGNHEFDKGFADLQDHLMKRATWKYLGANVYNKGSQNPALPEYATFDRDGVTVGVIGGVTEQTPSLVSPDGIASLDFGDPVVAANRVSDQLTDGNADNGEADVIVASFHEGASEGTPEGGTLEEEVAAGGAFAHIVKDLSPKVDAVFTGHTHRVYAWDAPVPGAPGKTRPVVQTGEYGNNVGQIRLFVDPATGEVSSYSARNVARSTTEDLGYPRVQAVKTVVDAALAEANVIGSVAKGQVSSDITTAYATGHFDNGRWVGPDSTNPKTGRDDRGSESTLGNLVAESLRATLSDPSRGGAEIGVTNPGGLRDELFYKGIAGSDTNKDGVITYAEANAVLPFVNNLWTVDLTGAQFKQVLEQQWQTDANGNVVTSRPFQHLGLSDNVAVTLDPSRAPGDRVTSVRVDGEPLVADRTYTIGTVSFLATGGDNFRAFAQGKGTDTGLVDRDAWISYLEKHKPLAPEFDRRQVYATGLPGSIGAGDTVSFTLNRLNLTSLGSPENRTVDVVLKTGNATTPVVGSPFPVTGGSATIAFTAPATIPAGSTFVATARPSGTTVTIPATETQVPAADTTTVATVSPSKVVVRSTRPTITATVRAGDTPVDGGTVNFYVDGRNVGSVLVTDGTASVQLPAFAQPGSKHVSVEYTGVPGTTNDSADTLSIKVVKATPSMKVTVGPKTVHRKKTHARLTITLTAPGQTVSGYVSVRTQGRAVGVVRLSRGTATVTLPTYPTTGRKSVTVRYLGSDLANEATKHLYIRVVR
jgi:5'-nucleotidase